MQLNKRNAILNTKNWLTVIKNKLDVSKLSIIKYTMSLVAVFNGNYSCYSKDSAFIIGKFANWVVQINMLLSPIYKKDLFSVLIKSTSLYLPC